MKPFAPGVIAGYRPQSLSPGTPRYTKFQVDEPDPDWRDNAACRGHDPEMWFPVGDTGPALMQIIDAKQICYQCPVIDACLAWALSANESAGVWGGLSEAERRNLKRQAVRQAARAAR